MVKKHNFKTRLLSVFIGIIAGIWIGWVAHITLTNYTEINLLPVWMIVGGILVGLMALKLPRTTEILIAGFVVAIIVIGALWDLIINDWSRLRAMILLSGLGIIIVDVFLGSITYKDIGKMAKRMAGAKG